MKKHGHNRFGWLFNGDPTASTLPFSRDGGAETTIPRDDYLSAGRDDGTNARSALKGATSPGLASFLDTSAPDSLAASSLFGTSAFSAAISPELAAAPINRDPVANSDSYSTHPNPAVLISNPRKAAVDVGWRTRIGRLGAMKIEGNSGCSANIAGKQCVMVLTSNLIEVLMIFFRCPAHFDRCPHPLAESRRRLDREGSGGIPGFAGRA